MSYTQMNAKFSTVENTVVTKGDVLSQANLPMMSNKYQIRRGYYVFTNVNPLTGVDAGTAAGSYNLVDELTGKAMTLQSGTYIDKVIAYSGLPALSEGTSIVVGMAPANSGNTVQDPSSGDLLLFAAAASTDGTVNRSDPSTIVALTSGAALLASLNAGMSCHPDIVVGPTNKNVNIKTAGSNAFKGVLNVLIFVAFP